MLRLAITLDLELNGTTVTVKLDVENAHGKQPNLLVGRIFATYHSRIVEPVYHCNSQPSI